MRRSLGRRLRRTVALALPAAVGLFLALIALVEEDLSPALTLLGVLVGLVQGAALWWRRSHPRAAMAVALAGGAVTQLLAPETLIPYAALIALFALTCAQPPRVSLLALAGTLGVTALDFRTGRTGDAWFLMTFPLLTWALGEVVRNRRSAIAEASRRAVGEEQARIARELHDVIAHSVSVIVVQAAAAGDVFAERPDQARRALRSIELAARDALGELRQLLGPAEGAPEGEALRPAPGLDRIDELAGPLRAAGLEIVVRREGEPMPAALPASVDLSAYRIVQEALTNTLRHSGASSAEVTVSVDADALELDVRDDGRGGDGGASGGCGRGLAGMRERAALVGGSVEAAPLPEGGFRVHARLPLERAR